MARFTLFLGLALAAVGPGCVDRPDITPLMRAARTGDLATMRRLLDAGADPNERDVLNGWTPLFHAIHKGQLEAVRLLLDRGVNPNQGARGAPAVRFAELNGEIAIADLLIAYGANPDAELQSPVQHLLDRVDRLLR
ncbi:MAG TPA: ankyrin repeat domain-containing protein [Vicinamibacterales bacterium]|nr:ankyrin repeat domain-containing protein [Vicinamibacterales bacterium]